MRGVFADAAYWIALLNRKDQSFERAIAVSKTLQSCRLYTTDEVLTEVLNYFSSRGSYWRKAAHQKVVDILDDPNVTTLPQARTTFREACSLYVERADKGYSLTDCISMIRMQELGLTEVLTTDSHFIQAGFKILM